MIEDLMSIEESDILKMLGLPFELEEIQKLADKCAYETPRNIDTLVELSPTLKQIFGETHARAVYDIYKRSNKFLILGLRVSFETHED